MTGKTKNTEPTPPEQEASEQDGKRSLIRHPLTSLGGLIAEAARVYRTMRDNKIDHGKGRSLVWVLSQMNLAENAVSRPRKVVRITKDEGETEDEAVNKYFARHPEDVGSEVILTVYI